ncbi:MAG: rod shape-determining protein MreC [Rubrivivax sp.]
MRQAREALRAGQLERDNASLRALLDLGPALTTRSLAAEVLYEAADPYSHKWVINRGSRQGVALGSPVINGAGVLGQVTRLYGATAEVTLLTDKDAAIPVLNARTSQRAAAFGNAGPLMELRFTSANSDVRPGDALVTSGLDGVYPAGLPVATVNTVDRRAEAGFARIMLTPAATPDGVRFDARAGAGRRASSRNGRRPRRPQRPPPVPAKHAARPAAPGRSQQGAGTMIIRSSTSGGDRAVCIRQASPTPGARR